MPRVNTKESFIRKSVIKHGNKYDYSNVTYVNNKTPVEIICPEHGTFYQRPDSHLNGKGCQFCALEKRKSLLYGVGINDTILSKNSTPYSMWKKMLERCYGRRSVYKSYRNCIVCEEWHNLSGFLVFFDTNYIEGFELDKDFLVTGNRVYGPSTCLFIPKEINTLLVRCGRGKDGILHGIRFSVRLNKYVANVNNPITHKREHLGVFDTVEQAEFAYISRKKEIIKKIADKYKSVMPTRTYKYIINHKF